MLLRREREKYFEYSTIGQIYLEGIWNGILKNVVSWIRKKTQGKKLARQFLNKWAVRSHEPQHCESKCQVANVLWIGTDEHMSFLPSIQKSNSKASYTLFRVLSEIVLHLPTMAMNLSTLSLTHFLLVLLMLTRVTFSSGKNSKWARAKVSKPGESKDIGEKELRFFVFRQGLL